jgi:hypothetical protein
VPLGKRNTSHNVLKHSFDVARYDNAGLDSLQTAFAHVSRLEKSVYQLKFGFWKYFTRVIGEEADADFPRLQGS